MATFTRVNGTTQPVFALDVANGSIAGTANVAAQGPVMLSGPKLDFFQLIANGALTNAGNVNGYLNNVFQAVQSGAGIAGGGAGGTIAFYQAGATAGTINIAIYPSGAYTTATILAAAQNANSTGGLTAVGWSSASYAAVFTTPTP